MSYPKLEKPQGLHKLSKFILDNLSTAENYGRNVEPLMKKSNKYVSSFSPSKFLLKVTNSD